MIQQNGIFFLNIILFESEVQFLTDFCGGKTSLKNDNPVFYSSHAAETCANTLVYWVAE